MSWLVLLGCGSSSTHPTQGSPTGACHQCLTFRQIQPVCGHWPQIYVPRCLSAEEKWLFASSFLFPIAMTNPAVAMASVAQGCLGALLQKEEILDMFFLGGKKRKAEKLRPRRMEQVPQRACGRSQAPAGRTGCVLLQDAVQRVPFLLDALKQLRVELSNLLLAFLKPTVVQFLADDYLGALKQFVGSGN